MSLVDHPNVVKFVDFYEDRQFIYVIMEKCGGEDVFDKLIEKKRFKESEVVGFCRQIFSAIEYLHDRRIIHRDIRAENFLYSSDGSIKLIDFGLAIKVKTKNQTFSDVVGSPPYMSPDMLSKRYSYPVDMWSAGVLVFLMLHGRYPIEDDTDEIFHRKLKSAEINWVSSEFTPSSHVLEFLQRLLEPDMHKRITPLEALNHQFLRHKSSSEQSDTVMVSESVADQLNKSVVLPGKSRRKLSHDSPEESTMNFRIQELEKQFHAGSLRGWRKSFEISVSEPSSPKVVKFQHHQKSSIGIQSKSITRVFERIPESPSPNVKRASSLPGSRVRFDANPPEMYVYTNGASGVIKVSPTDPKKRNAK